MEKELRITMRYDNLYKYDVHVDCDNFNSTGICTMLGGYAVALLQEMSHILNFRIKQLTTIGAYDFENATLHDVDLFVGSYVLRQARIKLVDPTFVVGFSNLVTFLNHEHESLGRDILFLPFSFHSWIAFCGQVMFSLVTIFLIHTLYLRLCRTDEYSYSTNTGSDIVFEGIASILQKSTLLNHTLYPSVRLALCCISLCFLFLTVSYSGTVVAILSTSKSGITSLEALISSEYSILLDKGYNNGSSSQIILEGLRAKDIVIDRFLKKASKSKIKFDTFEKSILTVQNKPVALVTEDDSGLGAVNSAIGQLPCSWAQIPVRGIRYPLSMSMKKNMIYKQEINSLLLKMSERGVMNYLRRKWIHQDGKCLKQQGIHRAVTLPNLSTGFYIVGSGILCSILIIIAEIRFNATLNTRKSFCKD